MLGKEEKNSQNLSRFLSSFGAQKRACISYDMKNYIKAIKNSLNKIINIILGLQ